MLDLLRELTLSRIFDRDRHVHYAVHLKRSLFGQQHFQSVTGCSICTPSFNNMLLHVMGRKSSKLDSPETMLTMAAESHSAQHSLSPCSGQ